MSNIHVEEVVCFSVIMYGDSRNHEPWEGFGCDKQERFVFSFDNFPQNCQNQSRL